MATESRIISGLAVPGAGAGGGRTQNV